MTLRQTLAAALAALCLGPVWADEVVHPEGLHIHDAYARATGKTGAIYFMVHNNTEVDDRILSAETDVAERSMLHSQTETADGIMEMRDMADGLPLPAGEMVELVRGGDHIMLMGMSGAMQDGDTITLTLTFAHAAPMVIEVPVDNARKPGEGGHDHGAMKDHEGMDHEGMDHEGMDHDAASD
jgi:periplasmic copper chaperone A